ncbi:MAG: PIN domain nuclease [bacterium]|nr:PIN domain nuclease [bacterium]
MAAAVTPRGGPHYLVDKSALARSHLGAVAERLAPLYPASEVATCPIIDLELLFSVRNDVEQALVREELRAMRSFPVDGTVTDRAIEVQGFLAGTGRHRLPITDLLIAAVAEVNDLVVLHYDKDFDTIAGVTGQRTEWIAPRGSL